MSRKTQNGQDKQGYICFVYGGCMKLGFVRYFATENVPEDEFEKYKDHYGNDIKGKYIKVVNPSEAYTKVKAELAKLKDVNSFGDIYELGVASATKTMKEITGVKKSSTWGTDSVEEVDKLEQVNKTVKSKQVPNSNKITVKGKTVKPPPQTEEIEQEDDEIVNDDKESSDIEQDEIPKKVVIKKVVKNSKN